MVDRLDKLGLNGQFKDNFNDMKAKMLLISKKTIEASQCFMLDMGIQANDPLDQTYNARCFLTAFLIYYHPSSVLIDPFDPIYFAAKTVIKAYMHLLSSINNDTGKGEAIMALRTYVSKYLEVYKLWEQTDRKRMTNDLLIQYFDIENTLAEINEKDKEKEISKANDSKKEEMDKKSKGVDPVIIKQLKGQQNVVYNRLKKFHSEHHIEKWTKKRSKEFFSIRDMIYRIREENLTGFEYVGNPIEISAKTAYWDYFSESLKGESERAIDENSMDIHKKNQDTILSTLVDFREKMKSLVPHRKDLLTYYDEHIDIEYIRHLMDNQVFKNDSLRSLVNFTFERLKELDSSFGAKQIEGWLERWELINQFPYDVHEVLPYILRDIMNKVEKIAGMTEYFKSVMDSDSKNPSK